MSELESRSLAEYVIFLAGRGKLLLFVSFFIGGGLLFGASFFMPVLFRSEALLMVAPNDVNRQLDVPGGISALASLGGIQLGGARSRDDVVLEVAKSRSFVTDFISRRKVRLAEASEDVSLLKRYKFFMARLSITRDKFSGLISISYMDEDRIVAKEILDFFVADLNTYMRNQDVDGAKRSLEYLVAEISQSNQDVVRKMLYGLMENNYRKIALANSTEEYALTIIDHPYVPEVKYSPQRIVLSAAGAILGLLFGVGFLHYRVGR